MPVGISTVVTTHSHLSHPLRNRHTLLVSRKSAPPKLRRANPPSAIPVAVGRLLLAFIIHLRTAGEGHNGREHLRASKLNGSHA
uniref:Uncharacterized protein n=1 Tax=Oryza rufipogon TaxID=4529 RepID=A0A0E0NZV9_ORYRU